MAASRDRPGGIACSGIPRVARTFCRRVFGKPDNAGKHLDVARHRQREHVGSPLWRLARKQICWRRSSFRSSAGRFQVRACGAHWYDSQSYIWS